MLTIEQKPKAQSGKGGAPEPIAISKHPQLFLDDYLIAHTKNLHRDMKRPVKHPANPLIMQDFPWESRYMNLWGNVLWEPELGKYRTWYLANEFPHQVLPTPPGISKLGAYYVCYAESTDGIHWVKPMVGKGKLGEHAQHNMVIPGTHGACVMKTPWDPDPNRLYKAEGGNLCATSPDGINWEVRDCTAAFGKSDTIPSFVYWKGEYLAFLRTQDPHPLSTGVMRGEGLSVSKDFVHWTPKRRFFVTDERDGYPWHQIHALGVTNYGDVLVGMLAMLHIIPEIGNNIMGHIDVQLMTSRDGWNWNRVADRAVFWPADNYGPIGSRPWDARFHPPANVLIKDDTMYFYYHGSTVRWGEGSWLQGRLAFDGEKGPDTEGEEFYKHRSFGIGLATLPADRFLSMRPINWLVDATLTTPPLQFSGDQILVNADIDYGALWVELLDEQGKVVPGFGREQSRVVQHDKLRYRAVWEADGVQHHLPEGSVDRSVALRFTVRNGELYAFQIADAQHGRKEPSQP